MDYGPPGSSVYGISQARILVWVAIPFSRGSFQPKDWTRASLNPSPSSQHQSAACGWESWGMEGVSSFLLWPLKLGLIYLLKGFLGGASGKEPSCQWKRHKRSGFNPWVRKIPWRRAWPPTPVFLPGELHGQRSLSSYCPYAKNQTWLMQLSTHVYLQKDGRFIKYTLKSTFPNWTHPCTDTQIKRINQHPQKPLLGSPALEKALKKEGKESNTC